MPTERSHLAILIAAVGAVLVLAAGLIAGPIAGGVALLLVAGAAAFALGTQGLLVAAGAAVVIGATFAIGHHDGSGSGSGTAQAAGGQQAALRRQLEQAKTDLAGATSALADARKGRDEARNELSDQRKLTRAFQARAHKAERRLRRR